MPSITRAFGNFLLALSFLSRLAPARMADESRMRAALFWFPLCGIVIGLVLILPFLLGVGATKPFLQGLLFAVFALWLTRALHWDGWTDLFDALGSGKKGEEFLFVLKDSRIGCFGAAALCMGLFALVFCSAQCFVQKDYGACVLAVIFGRAAVAPLACGSAPACVSSLGKIMTAASTAPCVIMACALPILISLIAAGLATTFFSLVSCIAGIVFLRRTARLNGGMNGDYMGAGIIWCELAVLLTHALV